MSKAFNDWWNDGSVTEDNLHEEGTPAYWAWEGWLAGVKAEREACAKVCDELAELNRQNPTDALWQWEECAAAIRNRSNT